jgi:hypothetical protein
MSDSDDDENLNKYLNTEKLKRRAANKIKKHKHSNKLVVSLR